MSDILEPKYHLENESFSIQFMRRTGFSSMATAHAHSFYEIYYLRKGERVYFLNGKVNTVKSGDMIVINPNDVHRTASSTVPEFERVLINFTHEFIKQHLSSNLNVLPFQQGSQIIRFPVEKQSQIERTVFEMLKECKHERPGYLDYTKALLSELLIEIYRQSFQSSPAIHHPMHEKISEIATYLQQHYNDNVTLQNIAEQFYISPSYLSRTFKKVTGFYFNEYIQAVRMREARRQLIETDEKILNISVNVGFHSIAHFNKTFKKMSNLTPMQFRKQNKHLSSKH